MTESMNSISRLQFTVFTFWSERNARERLMLAGAAAFALLGLVMVLLIDPALSGRAQLSKTLPELRQQAAAMQALAKEAAALNGREAVAPPPLTRESIEAALGRKGLNAQNIVITGDFAKLQLNAVPFSGLLDWLAEEQRNSRISVQEATINSLPTPGLVVATLTLRQQRGE